MSEIDFFSETTRAAMRAPLVEVCATAMAERSVEGPVYALCLAWRTTGSEVTTGFELYLAEDTRRRTADGGYDSDPSLVWNPMEWPFEPVDAYSDVLPALDPTVRSMLEQFDATLEAQMEELMAAEDRGEHSELTTDESVGYQILLLMREVAAQLGERDLGFERTDDFVAYALHLDRRDFGEVPEQASPQARQLLIDRGLLEPTA